MRKSNYYLLIMFLVSLLNSQKSPFVITKSTKAKFLSAKTNQKKLIRLKKYKKQNGSIKFSFNKKCFVFKDSLTRDDIKFIQNNYLGSNIKLNMHCIEIKGWENYKLITYFNDLNKKLDLYYTPRVSPNNSLIATYSMFSELADDDRPNGLTIYNYRNGLSVLIEIKSDSWSPYDLVWSTNSEIFVKIRPFTHFDNYTYYEYIKISIIE